MRKFCVLHNVTIEILNYCNSKCVHCYLGQPTPRVNELENVIRVIDQAVDAGAMQITLTGGEPLLHPHIETIIKYVKSRGLAVNLLTSLNIQKDDWISVVTLCDKVGVSMYGASPKVHDKITRINGSFDIMQDNLMYLRDKNVCVTLNITIMKDNIEDLINMVAFANQYSVPYRLNYILHGFSHENHQINCDQIGSLKALLLTNNYEETMSEQFKCAAGTDRLWIDVDLNVYPCVFFRKLLGNLFIDSLSTIWNSSESLACIRKTSNCDFQECRACDLKYFCKPCMGENYNANGDITKPCAFNCRIGEYGKHLMDC